MLSQSSVTSSSTQGRARPVGGEAEKKTVQWTVFPPNALRPAQGRENGRCPVKGTGRSLSLMMSMPKLFVVRAGFTPPITAT